MITVSKESKGKLLIDMGKRTRRIRRKKKLTQEDLGEMVGLCSKSISEIERGGRGMSLVTLYNLSEALEVSTDWLMGKG